MNARGLRERDSTLRTAPGLCFAAFIGFACLRKKGIGGKTVQMIVGRRVCFQKQSNKTALFVVFFNVLIFKRIYMCIFFTAVYLSLLSIQFDISGCIGDIIDINEKNHLVI